MKRLLIIQPYMARYRVDFFMGLGRVLTDHDIALTVGVGRVESARNDSGWGQLPAVHLTDRLSDLTSDRVRWRSLRGQLAGTDLIITERAIRNVETYGLLARQASGAVRVALWGHGGKERGLKRWLTQSAEWFFAYTPNDAIEVVRAGFPSSRVTIVGNTIDTEPLMRDMNSITHEEVAQFRDQHGLTEGRTALFIGGVDDKKDPEYLLDSARAAGQLDARFRLLVAGDGSRLNLIRVEQSKGARIVALGRVDGRAKAMALRASDLLMIPTGVGLVAVDSLAAGRPIVTRRGAGHGPEAGYLRSDDRALWVPGAAPAKSFAANVIGLMRDRERLEAMQARCASTASAYGMDAMVDRFAAGVLDWDGSGRVRG